MSSFSPQFRRAELVLCAFFLYVSGVALFRPVTEDVRLQVLSANTLVLLTIIFIAGKQRPGGPGWIGHLRDWGPAALILLGYREMGWMALPHPNRDFENYWIAFDRALLNGGLRAAIESLGPVLPNLLELSYLLVYAVPPLAVTALYVCRKRERMDDLYLILLTGTLLAYACYPWFPSDTPRRVFAGLDLPMDSLLRRLNLKILGGYGISTSVFPSGHSAAAFAAGFALLRVLPERRWWGRGMMTLAVLIAIATVYGRYHFAIDTIAGLGCALAALGVAAIWKKSPSTRQ